MTKNNKFPSTTLQCKIGQRQQAAWFIGVDITKAASLNTHMSLAVDELRDMVLGDRSKSESER